MTQPAPPCRKLRLNNARVQQCVVEVEGALELLQASGFELDLGGEGTNSGTGVVFAAGSGAQCSGCWVWQASAGPDSQWAAVVQVGPAARCAAQHAT